MNTTAVFTEPQVVSEAKDNNATSPGCSTSSTTSRQVDPTLPAA